MLSTMYMYRRLLFWGSALLVLAIIATQQEHFIPPQVTEPMNDALQAERKTWMQALQRVDIQDLSVGQGEPALCGQRATVEVVAYAEPGKPFMDTKISGKPVTFVIGKHEVPRGLEFGSIGMRPQGSRKVMVPAALSAGDETLPVEVPKTADLAFEITLKEVSPPLPKSDIPLKVFEEEVGNGRPALCGDTIQIHYAIYDLEGKRVAVSQAKGGSGAPIPLTLGGENTPIALTEGLSGIRPGGKRTLIVPPAYQRPFSGKTDALKIFSEASPRIALIEVESAQD